MCELATITMLLGDNMPVLCLPLVVLPPCGHKNKQTLTNTTVNATSFLSFARRKPHTSSVGVIPLVQLLTKATMWIMPNIHCQPAKIGLFLFTFWNLSPNSSDC